MNSKGKDIGGRRSGRLRFLSFPFFLISHSCCGSYFLSHATDTRSHSLLAHHSLSHSLSSLDVRLVHRVSVFDLVRYLHRFLSSCIAPGWGIRVFKGLAAANRQLCALSSPSDNSSLYSSSQPTTNTNPKNHNVLLREYIILLYNMVLIFFTHIISTTNHLNNITLIPAAVRTPRTSFFLRFQRSFFTSC